LRGPLLDISERGPVNMHPSLLPRHRGPTPVSTAILSGDAQTGVTTMIMDEGMDTGPVLLQKEIPLPPDVNRGELGKELAQLGAQLVVETLRGIRDGSVKPHSQREARATYTHMIEKSMRDVDWSLDSDEVVRRINALAPRPGARSRLESKIVKLLHAGVDPYPTAGEPGEVVGVTEAGVRVACGVGAVVLRELHPEGRKPMAAAAFARGGGVKVGDCFTF
jgi:methionyl-tRNA formyltransferase